MLRIVVPVLAAAFFAAASKASHLAGQQPGCAPASMASDFAVSELRVYASSTAPAVVSLRAQYGLQSVSPDSIVLLSVDSVCARAAAAADSVEQVSIPDRQMYVYRFGVHRVVDWVRPPRDHARAALVFDSTWLYKGPLGLTVVD